MLTEFCITVILSEFATIKKILLSCCSEERVKALEFLPGTCEQIFVD